MLKNIGKTEIVDPEYFSAVEPTSWANVTDEIRNPVDHTSEQNYQDLSSSEEYPASYVFATGPSLDDVFNIEIPEDVLTIICNSIVRNEELLEHLQPDILVFADPVFHFGPSKYAHKFRQDAIEVLREYNCKAVIPSQYHSLLAGHYPELSNQFIGINSVPADDPIYPTSDQLEVMQTANIMTLYMLPIATSLTDDVRIVGADGREEDESYFWKHSDTAQYDNKLMKTVVKTHPSFFRDRIYEDYYDQHVQTLTEMIEYWERDGIQFRNLTHSYIPCLSQRRVDPTELKT
jgi:DNA-binding ferritin-like protein (Dps family)